MTQSNEAEREAPMTPERRAHLEAELQKAKDIAQQGGFVGLLFGSVAERLEERLSTGAEGIE